MPHPLFMLADPQIELVATIPSDLREALEQLFFFNPRQGFVRDGIRASVEQHGVPEIMERDGRLWIGVPSGVTQCLFACDRSLATPRLVGVVVFCRPRPEALCITHLAVDPEYAAGGSHGVDGLGAGLVATVRQIARRTNGVITLELPYRPGCRLPVGPPNAAAPESQGKAGQGHSENGVRIA
jgi:hypothetical protein